MKFRRLCGGKVSDFGLFCMRGQEWDWKCYGSSGVVIS